MTVNDDDPAGTVGTRPVRCLVIGAHVRASGDSADDAVHLPSFRYDERRRLVERVPERQKARTLPSVAPSRALRSSVVRVSR